MKKILALFLAIILSASVIVTVSAEEVTPYGKKPFGTVLNATYTPTPPDMSNALPDETWGEIVIHVDKDTENAGITNYKYEKYRSEGTFPKADQTLSFDMYLRWDNDYLYMCLVSPDAEIVGSELCHHGDGYQIYLCPGYVDISCYNTYVMGSDPDVLYNNDNYAYMLTYDFDGFTPQVSPIMDENQCKYTLFDENKTMVAKIAFNLKSLGYKPPKNDDAISISMCRVDGSKYDGQAYIGWLEYGKVNNLKYCESIANINTSTGRYWVPESNNVRTKSANTIVLTGKEDPKPIEEQPTAPVLTEQPSAWALEEVTSAVTEGLVPENLQKGFTKPVTRGAVAEMFINLLETASKRSIDDIMKDKGVTPNPDAFTDTTDSFVLVANALGILGGTGGGKFSPDGTLKRAQIAAIINRVAKVMGVETTGFTHDFTDITSDYAWVDAELGWPVSAGIIKGVSDGKFNPGGELTTEQAILITYRALGVLKK